MKLSTTQTLAAAAISDSMTAAPKCQSEWPVATSRCKLRASAEFGGQRSAQWSPIVVVVVVVVRLSLAANEPSWWSLARHVNSALLQNESLAIEALYLHLAAPST